MSPLRRCLVLSLLPLALPVLAAAPDPAALIEVPASPRSPYAALRQVINVTVGRSVSLITGTYDYYYVRAYDAEDGNNPFIIDLPVFVRTEDTSAAKILAIVNARLQIGRHMYRPRDVLLLDHTAVEPVPDVPDGARIALVSFSIPRKALNPRFKARLAYEQPHLALGEDRELCAYLPTLPDVVQLGAVHAFKPDDFLVTFTALPDVVLTRDSVNAEVVAEDPDTIAIRARDRESILVIAEAVAGDE